MKSAEIIARLRELQAGDLPTQGGRTLAYVYDSGIAEADALGKQALAMHSAANGLDPTAFSSLLVMEKEIVEFAKPLLHAPESAVATVTSGGTESILLAVKTARDANKQIAKPVMIVPDSIHSAFHKAGQYFLVERITVPVDPVTKHAVPEAMAKAMDEYKDRAVLVAASAPSYAHGVIDPIAQIAAAASERGIRMHVDACIGGWVLPWIEEVETKWDFAVPGVTSISADLHKYAYTPKGVSLLFHRDPELRKAQYFASADWPGYTMLNSTMQSTKSGGPLAAAWAVVNYFGDEGYRRLARSAFDATKELAKGIASSEHLSLIAQPESTLIAFTTDDALDVFTLSDEMLDLGWFVQPQMSFKDHPASIHLTVSAATAESVNDFLEALSIAVEKSVVAGPIVVDEGLRAAAQSIAPEELDDAAFEGLLELAGLGGNGSVEIPQRMAPVNALLDVAPVELRAALLVAFLDRLTR